MNIVPGSSTVASYPQGGGHWSVYLQYHLGLRALGHKTFLIELLPRSGRAALDRQRISIFLTLMRRWGFGESSAVILHDGDQSPVIDENRTFGCGVTKLKQIIREADALWNFHCSILEPLLREFAWKVLLDLDPGILQLTTDLWASSIHQHDSLFSVGSKIKDANCQLPRLGREWKPFFPPVYLPFWEVTDSEPASAITSVTQWNWEFLPMNGRTLSISKRDAYLGVVDL